MTATVTVSGTAGPLLQVRGASVRFGPTAAVDDVDLAVDAGEVLAILGPSGSGKSTLLRAVAGLQPLAAGDVELHGRSLRGVPPHQRGIGLMFQQHALFPHRDVAGNIGFGPRMAGWDGPAVASRVEELLEVVGLAGFGRRAVSTLSGGEQQRVALARALAPNPSLLLLDEPLGALDRPLRDRLVGELRAIFGRLGQTVVAVTHDHQEALRLADRVAVMDAGRILQLGTPAEVWQRPARRRVAEVLGLPNLFEVVVRDQRADAPWGPVTVPGPDGPAVLHVPRHGLSIGPGGEAAGTVTSRSFDGTGYELTVTVGAGAVLELLVPAAGAPTPGDAVRLVADPAAMVRLEP